MSRLRLVTVERRSCVPNFQRLCRPHKRSKQRHLTHGPFKSTDGSQSNPFPLQSFPSTCAKLQAPICAYVAHTKRSKQKTPKTLSFQFHARQSIKSWEQTKTLKSLSLQFHRRKPISSCPLYKVSLQPVPTFEHLRCPHNHKQTKTLKIGFLQSTAGP